MKRLILASLGMVMACVTQANVDFYINAHADDAVLFMGESLAEKVLSSAQEGNKVVLVTATAGDAGAGVGNGLGAAPNYLAREQGHDQALQFLWGRTGAHQAQVTSQLLKLKGKLVHRAQIQPVTQQGGLAWYSLRLPDGNLEGQGYVSTGQQSLARLEQMQIRKMTAVDQSATYSKRELIRLLGNIIKKEGRGHKLVQVHLVDQNQTGLNVGDHSDHQTLSRLATTALAASRFSCVGQSAYSTYVNSNRAINMGQDNLWVHIAMWGALNQGLVDGSQLSTWEPGHNHWLGRQYSRPLRTASGTCAL